MTAVAEAETQPTNTKDLGNENVEDGVDVLASENELQPRIKKGTKRKRQDSAQLSNGEASITTPSIFGLEDDDDSNGTNVAQEEDGGRPAKKKKKTRMTRQDRKMKKQQPAQPQPQMQLKRQPRLFKEGKKLNRNQRRQRDLHRMVAATTTSSPPPPPPPSAQKTKKKKNNGWNHGWNKNKNHRSKDGDDDADDGYDLVVASPNTRSRARTNSMLSRKAERETRSRARTIITPPATSRPTSPESMRV